jgi:hypothetical protein
VTSMTADSALLLDFLWLIILVSLWTADFNSGSSWSDCSDELSEDWKKRGGKWISF